MENIKLGKCATFINGYAFKPTDWTKTGLPIIRIQNLTEGQSTINYYDKPIDKKYIVEKGDILVSWSGSIGVYEWTNGTAILNQHIFKVLLDKIDFNKEYFRYLLISKLELMKKRVHGSTMVHITKKDFDNIDVIYHDKNEQQKIADNLQLIESVIENRRKALAETDELLNSIFAESIKNKEFTDTLGDVCTFQQGTQFPVGEQKKEPEAGYSKFLRIINYTQDSNEFRYVKPKGKEYTCEKDDVVVVRYGATAGFVGHGHKGILANNLFVVIPDESKVIKDYLYYYLKTEIAQTQILKGIRQSSMPALNHKDMKTVKIILLDKDSQQKIVDKCRIIEEQKEMIEKDIMEANKLLTVMMNKYFN